MEICQCQNTRLSCYTPGMMVTKQNKSVLFEDGLRYDPKIQVAPHQERNFKTLVEKTKIVVEIKCLERKKREKNIVQHKREFGPTGLYLRPLKWPREDMPNQNVVIANAGGTIGVVRIPLCRFCDKPHFTSAIGSWVYVSDVGLLSIR